MASSGSLKDLAKAINAYYESIASLPLPDDLDQALDAYLDKHNKFDEAVSEKLHEELQTIYQKQVQTQVARHVSFIAILRRLIPVIRVPDRVILWWDTLRPIVLENPHEKGLLSEASAGFLDMLMIEDDYEDEVGKEVGNGANVFAERLYVRWLDKHYAVTTQGDPAAETVERLMREVMIAWGKKKPKEFLIVLDRFYVKSEYRVTTAKILCDFIQNQPPHLHVILQTALFGNLLRSLQQDTSTTVVSLTVTAVIMILPHMPSSLVPYLPVLFNIYARLLFWKNERTGIVEATPEDAEQKTLPPAAGWETCAFSPDSDEVNIPHLANYFTILYGLYPLNFSDYIRKPQRYLRHANAADSDGVDVQPTEIRHRSERFRRSHLLHPNFYTLTIESEKTDMGRWLNSEPAELVADCMALRMTANAGADDYDQVPALPGVPSSFLSDASASDREGPDAALLGASAPEASADSWRDTRGSGDESQTSSRVPSIIQRQLSQSSRPSNRDSIDTRSRAEVESPTLGPTLVVSPSQTQLHGMMQSNKAIKSGLHQSLGNESMVSLTPSQTESNPEQPPSQSQGVPTAMGPVPLPHADTQAAVAQLQHRIMLLQNDLNFERYLKQQHMTHIGELRRKSVREAASEAEAQHLIMANRNLKNRLEDAKKAEMQIRKESEKSRTLAKKWESDLSAKLRTLREDLKKTRTDEEALGRELESARQESEKLRKIVCDAEVRELNSRQNMQSIEMNASEIDRLKAEVERLTVSERDFQAKELERHRAVNTAAEAESRVEVLYLKLAAREEELQKTRKLFQGQAATLNAKLTQALEANTIAARRKKQHLEDSDKENDDSTEKDGEGGEEKKSDGVGGGPIGAALAASRTRQAELQTRYSNLLRKYSALQTQYEEAKLTASVNSSGGASSGTLKKNISRTDLFRMDGEDASMHSLSPVTSRSRLQRVLSDSDFHDRPTGGPGSSTMSFNMTPPLETPASTPVALGSSPGAETVVSAAGTGTGTGTGSSKAGSVAGSVMTEQPYRFYGRGGLQNNKLRKEKEKEEKEKEKARRKEEERKERKQMTMRGISGFAADI